MRGLSKPIPKANYRSKKKKIQEINLSKPYSSRDYAWQDSPVDGREEEAEAERGTSKGREEEAGMLNPCISSDP